MSILKSITSILSKLNKIKPNQPHFLFLPLYLSLPFKRQMFEKYLCFVSLKFSATSYISTHLKWYLLQLSIPGKAVPQIPDEVEFIRPNLCSHCIM